PLQVRATRAPVVRGPHTRASRGQGRVERRVVAVHASPVTLVPRDLLDLREVVHVLRPGSTIGVRGRPGPHIRATVRDLIGRTRIDQRVVQVSPRVLPYVGPDIDLPQSFGMLTDGRQ